MADTSDCKAVAAVLGIDPFYVIDPGAMYGNYFSADERRYLAECNQSGWNAFAGAINDLMFQSQLKYEWRGRGCCIAFAKPVVLFSRADLIGLTIHEVAHWLESYHNPARDDANHERAMRTAVDHARTQEESHNRNWTRALIHAWHRVHEAGLESPLSAMGIGDSFTRYGNTPKSIRPFFAEAEQREHESIESILRSPMPGEKRRTSKPRPLATTATPAKSRSRRRPQTSAPIPGAMYVNSNGTVTVDGRTYASEASYRESRRIEREARERAEAIKVDQRAMELAGISPVSVPTMAAKPTRSQILAAVKQAMGTTPRKVSY